MSRTYCNRICCLFVLLAALPLMAMAGAPVLHNPGPQYSFDGHKVALAMPVEGPVQVALAFRATGLPEGLSIDPRTGFIAGTVEAPGSLCTQVIIYMDADGETAETRFDWVVESKGVLSCGGGISSGGRGSAWTLLLMSLWVVVFSRRNGGVYFCQASLSARE